jgi:hypothetical protein
MSFITSTRNRTENTYATAKHTHQKAAMHLEEEINLCSEMQGIAKARSSGRPRGNTPLGYTAHQPFFTAQIRSEILVPELHDIFAVIGNACTVVKLWAISYMSLNFYNCDNNMIMQELERFQAVD